MGLMSRSLRAGELTAASGREFFAKKHFPFPRFHLYLDLCGCSGHPLQLPPNQLVNSVKLMKANTIPLTLILFTAAWSPAQSATLVAWNVDGLDVADDLLAGDHYAFAATSTALNVESTNLTLGSGLIPSDTAGQYGFKVPTIEETTSLADAISAGHFFQFEVQASPGYLLDLTKLEMNGQSSGTGANEVALLVSTDNFLTSSTLGSLSGISGNTGGFDTDPSGFGSIDLSSFTGVDAVSFRLYGSGTTTTQGKAQGITYVRNLTGDDLVIEGSVAPIPEVTSSLTLAGLLAFSAFARRRRPGA